jgi:hypothetical protein
VQAGAVVRVGDGRGQVEATSVGHGPRDATKACGPDRAARSRRAPEAVC